MSALEAATNVVVGYGISVGLTITLFPLFGYAVTAPDAFGISIAYVVASLARSYVLRRIFTRIR